MHPGKQECIAGDSTRSTRKGSRKRPFWTRKAAAEYGVRNFLLLLVFGIFQLAVSRCAYFERAAVAG